MKFWGAEVQGGVPLKVKPGDDRLIRVSQASLDKAKAKKGENVLLYVTINGMKYVMGTLSEENPQISFDLSFEKEFELSLSSQGSVHFIGYKSSNVNEEDDGSDDSEDGSDDSEDGSDDSEDESDDEEEEEEVSHKTSNRKRKNESATPVSAKKAKLAETATPQKTGESAIFERAQRLNDLVRSHDPLTKTYLNTFSKEVSYATPFPSYHVQSTTPLDEAFLLPDVVFITEINHEATEDDVVKFLKDNKVAFDDIELVDKPDTNEKEAAVLLASREALDKAMELSGRRICLSANGKYNQVIVRRTKNGLRVFTITGHDHTLSGEEIIEQVQEAFTSNKPGAGVVKKVIIPENKETGGFHCFCYIIMDNIDVSNKADVLAVTTVGDRKIVTRECSPKAGVFDRYLND